MRRRHALCAQETLTSLLALPTLSHIRVSVRTSGRGKNGTQTSPYTGTVDPPAAGQPPSKRGLGETGY